MTDLKDIQTLTVNTILAGPSDDVTYFAGESVIADAGLSRDTIEEALSDAGRGFVTIVDLPADAEVFQRNPGVVLCYVTIPVTILLHPVNNTNGAQKNILEALQKLSTALLEYSADDEAERFELMDDAFHLSMDDRGVLAYPTRWRKMISLSTNN